MILIEGQNAIELNDLQCTARGDELDCGSKRISVVGPLRGLPAMSNILTTSAILPSSLSVPISSRLFHFLSDSDPRSTDNSMIAADPTISLGLTLSDH